MLLSVDLFPVFSPMRSEEPSLRTSCLLARSIVPLSATKGVNCLTTTPCAPTVQVYKTVYQGDDSIIPRLARLAKMSVLINNLLPPNGTSFFKCEDIEICNKKLDDGRELHWWISVYKYCVGAAPTDPEFTKKGGHVLVLLVHNGVLYNDLNNWTDQISRVDIEGESSRQVRLYPEAHSPVPSGDKHLQYDIHFETSLPLFRNRGHESFIFQAQYKETFYRVGSGQFTDNSVNGRANRFTIAKKLDVSIDRANIRALYVLKCYDPSTPLKITFGQDAYYNEQKAGGFRKNVDIELF